MRRGVFAALALCLSSGCYTVLRHPAIEDEAVLDAEVSAPAVFGSAHDCRSCHEAWRFAPQPAPICPPTRFSRDPWWQRDGLAMQRREGRALANDRPPLPAPALEMARRPGPTPGQDDHTQAPSGAASGAMHASAPPDAGRQPPARNDEQPAASASAPAAPAAAEPMRTSASSGLQNDRPGPKP